ncbi:protein prune homolog 2 [Anopheles cruzii]|uniref:protein prune homolog 2 n=1 Tax=Anopheles cruzii TaxID=68878 RepID=UPI0022EC67CD|nr:protein prune homolog 2 [Anopheles cruzii]
MSQCLEDSPLSDNRMDISENTTSHESPPVDDDFSPDNEDDADADVRHCNDDASDERVLFMSETDMAPKPGIASHSSITEMDSRLGATTTTTPGSIEIRQLPTNSLAITTTGDGDVGSRGPSPSRIVTSSSGLTPVSSHPLMMSPTGSESDVSDIVGQHQRRFENEGNGANRNYYHYPDVVPVSEQPLRLSGPYSGRKHVEKRNSTIADEVSSAVVTPSRLKSSSVKSSVKASKRAHGNSVVATSTLDVINNAMHSSSVQKGEKERHSTSNRTSPSTRAASVRRHEEDNGSDFFSSDSEQEDASLFQAAVTPTFQSVALLPSPPGQPMSPTAGPKSISPRLHQRRKVPLPSDLLVDDASSIEDTLSNQSVDELQQNLVSLSPSSSILDDNGFNVDIDEDFLDLPGTPKAVHRGDGAEGCRAPGSSSPAALPQYTARDEARDIRNWQKITLPDGKTREIDMKVIEPYKCVLSHGGYLQAGGHNAIVVFSACHLPDRSRADYHYVMNNLFLYVVKTLEQLVTEDYVLIYLHGGSSRGNVPPFPWLKKCYQLLDRRLRKSLRNLYMVHPTFWLKSVVWMARPFISSKFWRKLVYVTSLESLYHLVPVEKAAVPDKVKLYDSR